MKGRHIEKEYIEERFGFPVVIKNAPMRQTSFGPVLDINAKVLRWAVMSALAFKPARLTGNEIRVIRLYLEKTVAQFAVACNVTHPAVLKWEESGNEATRMFRGTEFVVRFLLLQHVAADIEASPDTIKGKFLSVPDSLLALSQKVFPLSKQLAKAWTEGRRQLPGEPSRLTFRKGIPVLEASS